MLDITEEQVRRVDAQDMLGRVLAVPDQFSRALDAARQIHFTPPRAVERVLVTGLGGSAMGGDLVAAWAEREGRAPVVVNRTYEIPAWVDAGTLVIAVSYSGNTEETLAAFAESRKRGAMLAAVATGGKLEEFAAKTRTPFVKLEPGLQPRAALPRTFLPQAALLHAAGVLPDVWTGLEEAKRALAEMAEALGPDRSPATNEAKRIALALQDTVPVVYGSGPLGPVARRWSNNFNENSKVLSWWGILPELTHNEIVGWAGDADLDRFTAIFLRHEGEHAQNAERFAFMEKLIHERQGRVIQNAAPAKHAIAATFASALVGDAASVYLGVLREEDPTQVAVITRLKNHVGESGFARSLESSL